LQVDFDMYGLNGASKISDYRFNQIVPQLIIGWGGTNPSPGGFEYVNANKSSTWFIQVGPHFLSKALMGSTCGRMNEH